MVWFQILTLPCILVLLLRHLWLCRRRDQRRTPHIMAILIWGLAGLAILQPEWTTRLAARMGIGRGADFVLYLLVMAFLMACFRFYHRLVQIESSLSLLVRHTALQDGLQRWPRYEKMHAGGGQDSPAE